MKILFVQLAFLGDVVLSTPVISSLKQIYPDAELWALTTPQAKPLLENDPLLKGVLTFDKRNSRSGIAGLMRFSKEIAEHQFDAAYCLHRSLRTSALLMLAGIPRRVGFAQAKGSFFYTVRVDRRPFLRFHDVLRNLALLSIHRSIPQLQSDLRIFTQSPGAYSKKLQSLAQELGEFVAVFPGSAWYTKQWHWTRYLECINLLLQNGERVALFGSQADTQVCSKIMEKVSPPADIFDLSGQLGLDETLPLLKQSKLIISNDSLPVHLASALGIPNVAVFCATSPEFGFGPWKNRALVVERKDLGCKPCARHGGTKCPTGTEECFRGLEAREVFYAAEALLT